MSDATESLPPPSASRAPGRCPNCDCPDLYIRKDFPPGIGCGIVAVAIVAFLVLSAWRQMTMWGFMVLFAAAILDLIVYRLVGTVAVCYRCSRAVRDGVDISALKPFDLSVAEKYRHGDDGGAIVK
jgi:hypothetical protein